MNKGEWELIRCYLQEGEGFNCPIDPDLVAPIVTSKEVFTEMVRLYVEGQSRDGYEKLYNLIPCILRFSNMPLGLVWELLDQVVESSSRLTPFVETLLELLLHGISISTVVTRDELVALLDHQGWKVNHNLTLCWAEALLQVEDILGGDKVRSMLSGCLSTPSVSNYIQKCLDELSEDY